MEQNVINCIFGGTNIIASSASNFAQLGTIAVVKGDLASLGAALKVLGVQDTDISELKSALHEDGGKTTPSFGQRTVAWLGALGGKLGTAGIALGVEVAKGEAKKWILNNSGIDTYGWAPSPQTRSSVWLFLSVASGSATGQAAA